MAPKQYPGAIWGFGLIILAVLIGSCSDPRPKTKQIAVIPKGMGVIFWESIHAGAVAAGKDFQVEIVWNAPSTETDYSRQIQIMDAAITRRVDGIALSAADHSALNGAIDRAAQAKIPVTVFDSGVTTDNYMTFLATNNSEAGEMGAREPARLLNGKGRVAVIMHVPGSVSTMDRESRFEKVMAADFPGIQIVARQFGMANAAKAQAAAENILTANPNLDGIFSSAEVSTLGSALAIRGRGLSGKIKLVGFDVSNEILDHMKSGAIHALVVQDPFFMGHEAVRILVDKLNGKTPPKRIDLSAKVINMANLASPDIQAMLSRNLQ